jgi:hypothetical protein
MGGIAAPRPPEAPADPVIWPWKVGSEGRSWGPGPPLDGYA